MKAFSTLYLMLLAFTSFGQQKETFDLATYTIPRGWKKMSTTTDATSFAITNEQKGTFCQVGIYNSNNSIGSLQSDFDKEWAEIVVPNYKPSAKPELVPSTSDDGWEAQGGVAPFQFNGAQCLVMLVTMSGNGKCMSIVILTNTQDYQSQIESFLESVNMKKIDSGQTTATIKPQQLVSTTAVSAPVKSNFTFSTTNFDNGWTSVVQEDWVEATKGNMKVLIHYPNKAADEYNPELLAGLKIAWNILVVPKYSSMSNVEFKPISGWQSIVYAEANAIERVNGKKVHVVLFKYHYSGGDGKFLEFISPDKATFEREFGQYHESTYGWEKMEAMANYNKFAVASTDLNGKWTNDFSGMTQYVNAYTGLDAGAYSHASAQTYQFNGDTYQWDITVASGMVGNLKFQNAKSTGKHKLINNWLIHFSDMEGKPKTYNAYFSCIKGARILWLEDTTYPGYTGFGKKE